MKEVEKFKELITLCEKRESIRQPNFLFSISDENTISQLTDAINTISKELEVLAVTRGRNGLEIFLLGGLNRLQEYCEDEEKIEHKTETPKDSNMIYHRFKIGIGDFYLITMESEFKDKDQGVKQKLKENFERE